MSTCTTCRMHIQSFVIQNVGWSVRARRRMAERERQFERCRGSAGVVLDGVCEQQQQQPAAAPYVCAHSSSRKGKKKGRCGSPRTTQHGAAVQVLRGRTTPIHGLTRPTEGSKLRVHSAQQHAADQDFRVDGEQGHCHGSAGTPRLVGTDVERASYCHATCGQWSGPWWATRHTPCHHRYKHAHLAAGSAYWQLRCSG